MHAATLSLTLTASRYSLTSRTRLMELASWLISRTCDGRFLLNKNMTRFASIRVTSPVVNPSGDAPLR